MMQNSVKRISGLSFDPIGAFSIVAACVVRRTAAGESGHGYWMMMDRHKNVCANTFYCCLSTIVLMLMAVTWMIVSSTTAVKFGMIHICNENVAIIGEAKE